MDPDPPAELLSIMTPLIAMALMTTGTSISILLLLLLIVASALISGSEVAYFSLSPNDVRDLVEEDSVTSRRIISLKEKPRTLLATILIANNFINIAIVVISDSVLKSILGKEKLLEIGNWLFDSFLGSFLTVSQLANGFNFLLTVIGVTFILVLFGEVAPKLYANINNLSFAKISSLPLKILTWIFAPLSRLLVSFSNSIERRLAKNNLSSTSKEDIDKAIELTVNAEEGSQSGQEADILKGIVKFGDHQVKQIMKPRIDVVAIEIEEDYNSLMNMVKESGFSRIPVYEEDFDTIRGMLYVKDLLGHTQEENDFKWQTLIRDQILYVPESKKIDELLKEFQSKRMHMAIVVDEYGGSAGIVTLEDIMEEVIGDIRDEFDEDQEVEFIQIGKDNYIFEGKTLLNDVCRIIGEDTSIFDGDKGEADSLAGLILEITGVIPKQEKELNVGGLILKVISVSKRRIEKINVRKK